MLSLLDAAKLILARVDGPNELSADDYDELRAAVAAASQQVEVIVSGGVVQDVLGVPPEFDVVIKDYDVEGLTEEELAACDRDAPRGRWSMNAYIFRLPDYCHSGIDSEDYCRCDAAHETDARKNTAARHGIEDPDDLVVIAAVTLAERNDVLLETLKAIADPEHCLTRHTVDGLRRIARGAIRQFS